jgi:hypothetical protein
MHLWQEPPPPHQGGRIFKRRSLLFPRPGAHNSRRLLLSLSMTQLDCGFILQCHSDRSRDTISETELHHSAAAAAAAAATATAAAATEPTVNRVAEHARLMRSSRQVMRSLGRHSFILLPCRRRRGSSDSERHLDNLIHYVV